MATSDVEVQSFMSNPGGIVTESDSAVSSIVTGNPLLPYSVDIRSYIPAALVGAGYSGFLRVINTSPTATPVSIALIDGDTGTVGTMNSLSSALPAGAAVTYTASQIETALGTTIPGAHRPRIRVGTQQPVEVQSFMANPGGIMSQLSGAQSGATIDIRTYLPYALNGYGYVSFLRAINTASSPATVSIAVIDGDTGVVGTAAVLSSSLLPGAAVTYDAQQIEAALRMSLFFPTRPRLRVTSSVPIEVQSFMANPGGAVTETVSVQ
jgi:hypothetical protein